ncbi:hypothetical protein BXY80_1565 [Ichthyenterobacterium magnum]|uniref:Uncharacterized protein n=1 Tax=Ichthyenterobacterium magnum TaxID=1230530 RepID=A0A420DMF9_9FLAO|nr:hypothetical protein BXY80_1565 [Ichthyenterobacterium magnum]
MTNEVFIKSYIAKNNINSVHPKNSRVGKQNSSVCQFSCSNIIT